MSLSSEVSTRRPEWQKIAIGLFLALAEAAMLAAIWDLPKWVLGLSAVLQSLAAGSLYYLSSLGQIRFKTGYTVCFICLVANFVWIPFYFFGCFGGDLRQVPLRDPSFFSTLPTTNDSVRIWCFPYDAQSCSIALEYRKSLAAHYGILNWGEFMVAMRPGKADFKGINIATHSDALEDRPHGARDLAGKLSSFHIPIDWRTDKDLNRGQFDVWIGAKP